MVARLKLKGIDGGSHKRWSMWLNSRQREEPYPRFDMHGLVGGNIHDARKSGTCTGAAWLSSARAVRCRVKSFNERNPCRQLPAFKLGTLTRPPASSRRKAGTTSSHHGLYVQGCTRATMPRIKGSKTARWSKSQKARPSSDCRLQLACMKPESLVIADQLCCGECVPEPCTHRPSSHERGERPKSLSEPQGHRCRRRTP